MPTTNRTSALDATFLWAALEVNLSQHGAHCAIFFKMNSPPPKTRPLITPPKLRVGDKVRFVSPASTPDRQAMLQSAAELERWGLKVEFGEHAFKKTGFLAGTDEERLSDLNGAFRDPSVRAVIATCGGKGSYRIADRLDFAAVRRDPKFFIGYSDNTTLHLSLFQHCGQAGIHGAVEQDSNSLKKALMTDECITMGSREGETTSVLTTSGAAEGILIGGNLDMLSTSAGWNLPNLSGAILLFEAVSMHIGQVDRQLTMLRKAGHLSGLAAVAVGQFTGFDPNSSVPIIDLLREHLDELAVPVLGGLPVGHGNQPASVLIGAMATLDTNSRELIVLR
jgi:muramoyltetrapeptide carboxypeptidase